MRTESLASFAFCGTGTSSPSATRRARRAKAVGRASAATVQSLESRVLMSASLIKDINPGAPGSQIQSAVTLNNEVYFAANDGSHGQELWKSDGTAAGTVMVDDINPGCASSNPADLTVVGSSIYFAANDGVHGTELWMTRGTAATTTMVADINPGAASSNPADLTLGSGYRGTPLLYFMATGTDGTPQVYDAIPGSTPGVTELSQGLTNISELTSDGGPAFFSASDGVHGTELWTASPYSNAALIDINPGPGSSNPTDLTGFNGSIYCSADDGTHGRELWEASSPSYFAMVKDFAPGAASSDPNGLYTFNYSLYFSANGQLWRTRGDDPSTIQVTYGPQFSHVTFTPLSYVSKGNTIYFANYDSYTGQTELWQTDGTAAGTVQTAPGLHLDNSAPQLYVTESEIYFLGSASSGPDQLYQTAGDGTGAILADPSEQAGGWSPNQILGLANTTLLFSATDSAHGSELWGIQIPSIATASFLKTDTTTHGTFLQTYGFDGFVTPNENALPPSIHFSTQNASTYDWAPVTNDVRALQEDYPMSGNPFRDAPCYYSASQFSLDLNLTDGLTHQVALYLVDYDNLGRSETVQVSDAISGQVLSTQSINNFAGGKWLVYSMTGDVKITFINDGPVNAVVSAVAVGYQFNPPASGTGSYATTNTTLGGNWVGTYGSGGYDVLGDSQNIPASIDESSGGNFWEWQYHPTDSRALLTGPGSTTRNAFCQYSTTSFTFDLSFNDGKPHQLAIYLVDYDDLGRVETVQLSDTASGKILDSRTISHFQGGQYLVYNVSGDVAITFINAGPQNAVMSGLFIDPVSAPSGTASFVGTDATTQGSYSGIYGGDGYDVFNSASSIPSYAQLSIPSSVSNYTWDPNATSVNALQTSLGATTRIAACDYSNSPAFSFNLDLTDGNTHKVALYVLDYDFQHRAETIQIADAITGNLLDSENVSNFTAGKYLVWNISGDVNITITNNGGLNEVLSGVFFG